MKKVSTASTKPSRKFFSAEAHHGFGFGRPLQLLRPSYPELQMVLLTVLALTTESLFFAQIMIRTAESLSRIGWDQHAM